MGDYRPDPAILSLGSDFYDPVAPADFPKAIERFYNQRWAEKVGLGDLNAIAREANFAMFEPLADNLIEPLALRYHGHQFRVYNPDIGDGRGFLFAQLRESLSVVAPPGQTSRAGRLLDLGTKGSGTTPYSRSGDGRLTLKGAVREVLATEMLEALGVNTSKTFAIFETGEQLYRGDEPSPTRSAVLTRLSHGHIRIGMFQRLAFFRDTPNIAKLARYCLEQLFGEVATRDDAENAHRLFALASAATARLAAQYMAAGFVHGVLNSDNINVTGESFDYGPWRFTPDWDGYFTAAYFDEHGLYSFGRQAEAIHWDMAQLAGALSLVAPVEPLQTSLDRWSGTFELELAAALLARLGIAPRDQSTDHVLAGHILGALATKEVAIDRFFFDWRGGHDPGGEAYAAPPFRALAAALDKRRSTRGTHPYWLDAVPQSMQIAEVEAIWAAIAERDDWQPLDNKIKAIRRMGAAMAKSDSA